jgi:ATP-dependent Lhr-like helicase
MNDEPSDSADAVRSALGPLIAAQRRISRVPKDGETLIERYHARGGTTFVFVFPFQGLLVHTAAAALIASRIAPAHPGSYVTSVDDHGFLIRARGAGVAAGLRARFPDRAEERAEAGAGELHSLFAAGALEEDLAESLNLGEMARVEFREVAQIAGLVQRRRPGREIRLRQVQASSNVLFDVFREFDPEHQLYREAFRAVFERRLDLGRLRRTLDRISDSRIVVRETERPSPFAFPLFASGILDRVSTEDAGERLERLIAEWRRREPE